MWHPDSFLLILDLSSCCDLDPRLALIGTASLRVAEEDDWPQGIFCRKIQHQTSAEYPAVYLRKLTAAAKSARETNSVQKRRPKPEAREGKMFFCKCQESKLVLTATFKSKVEVGLWGTWEYLYFILYNVHTYTCKLSERERERERQKRKAVIVQIVQVQHGNNPKSR